MMIKAYTSIWAGAVTQKPPVKPRKLSVTDRPTDRVGHRVACTRLKTEKNRRERMEGREKRKGKDNRAK